MPIQNLSEAQARLQDTAPLAPEELRAIALFLPVLGPGPKARFEAEVAFQSIRAIEQLDANGRNLARASNKIGTWNLALNVALFAQGSGTCVVESAGGGWELF